MELPKRYKVGYDTGIRTRRSERTEKEQEMNTAVEYDTTVTKSQIAGLLRKANNSSKLAETARVLESVVSGF